MSNIEINIKRLQAMMLEVADDIMHKNPGKAQDEEFKNLIIEITETSREDIKQRLPECVFIYSTRQALNSFLKSEFGSYAERRTYVREQFTDILGYLQSSKENVINDTVSEILIDIPYIKRLYCTPKFGHRAK